MGYLDDFDPVEDLNNAMNGLMNNMFSGTSCPSCGGPTEKLNDRARICKNASCPNKYTPIY